MTDWIINFIESLHYMGIAMLMFLETFIPVVQSEIVMPFSGFAASQGSELNVVLVVIAGVLGSEIGAITLYQVAKKLPQEKVYTWISHHGRWIGISRQNVNKWSDKFDKHAIKTVLIGRFIPGIRGLVAIPAGMGKMPLLSFAIANLLGTIFWVSLLTIGGYTLGENYTVLSRYVNYVAIGVGLAFGGFVGFKLVSRYKHD